MTAAAPALAPDLAAGLAAEAGRDAPARPRAPGHRRTQRWAPEELLRTLVEAEITARDASNARHPASRPTAFPVTKTWRSSTPQRILGPLAHPGLPRLAGMDHRPRDLCLVSRPALAKATCSWPFGAAAVQDGHRVRYLTAAELAETLYRGLADNSVGRIIDTLLRNDLIITGAQLLFRLVAAAYERRALGIASHWPFEPMGPLPARAHHRRQPAGPAPAPRQRRRHRRRFLPHARSQSRGRQPGKQALINPRGGDF